QYHNGRWYDPLSGRWVSEIPIGSSSDVNPYRFQKNNPTSASEDAASEKAKSGSGLAGALWGFPGAVLGARLGRWWADPSKTSDEKLAEAKEATAQVAEKVQTAASDAWTWTKEFAAEVAQPDNFGSDRGSKGLAHSLLYLAYPQILLGKLI